MVNRRPCRYCNFLLVSNDNLGWIVVLSPAECTFQFIVPRLVCKGMKTSKTKFRNVPLVFWGRHLRRGSYRRYFINFIASTTTHLAFGWCSLYVEKSNCFHIFP